ncbi:MAG TPA: aromatic acid/H+ symport family MFS transporter, partial [Acetobacteraceae bacterium]|nr:aromatic acid/H+ symport family MFS transporter [Acetobacteraceae bacterium]
MPASSSINVAELIDRHPISGLQMRVILLCGLVALLDGFDVLAIGLAAPAMGTALHIAPSRFGVVFSAALLGLMLGA